jgi:hypothetical protein
MNWETISSFCRRAAAVESKFERALVAEPIMNAKIFLFVFHEAFVEGTVKQVKNIHESLK